MNQKIENLTLNMHIDESCVLYEKEKFLTVIQKTKKLLIKFNDSISLLNILGMSNSKIKMTTCMFTSNLFQIDS